MNVPSIPHVGAFHRTMRAAFSNSAMSVYEIIDALGRCWFLVLATLAVGILLVFVPQGREALWAAYAAGQPWHVWAFFATSLMGAVLVTLFASQILETGYLRGAPDSLLRGYACFAVPGMLGLLAAFLVPLLMEHLFAGNAYLLPERRKELRELGLLFQALVLPAVVLARCPNVLVSLIFPWRLERRQLLGVAGLVVLFAVGLCLSPYPFVVGTLVLFGGLAILDALWWRTGLEPPMRRWRRWAGFVIALGWLAAGFWVAGRPETRAPAIGPATLALFAEYFWLALAYVLFQAVGRWLRIGVTIVLFIVFSFLFMSGPFNLHSVRTLEAAASSTASARVTLSDHIQSWLEARRSKIEASSKPYPVFIASAEGGGIRAACWTAGVLSAIQDAEPEFADHILAISGVSGGSLGAATFVALVRESQLGNLDRQWPAGDTGPLQNYADEILGNDFLSPVLATMLIPDIASCLGHGEWATDRAEVLETAFEDAWRRAVGTETFEGPMNALWPSESRHRVPTLFMNSTEAKTGRRIVNSHVVFDAGLSHALSLPESIPANSLRLSTAVLLSARFPAISPIGSLESTSGSGPLQVVDGGYFDNSGTSTAAEVVTALNASAARLGLRDRIRIISIVITDDPIIVDEVPSDADKKNRTGIVGTAAGAFLAPFETLDSLRQAHSKKHRETLSALVRASGGETLDGFALSASRMEFPLGWMLSDATRSALTQQIAVLKSDPNGHFLRIRSLLSASRPRTR